MPQPAQRFSSLRLDPATRRVLATCVPLGLLAAFGIPLAVRIPQFYDAIVATHREVGQAFETDGFPGVVQALTFFSKFCAAAIFLAFLSGFVRRPWGLSAARKGYLAYSVWFLFYLYAVFAGTDVLLRHDLEWNGFKPDAVAMFYWRWQFVWPAGLALLVGAAVYVFSWRERALTTYGARVESPPAVGDRIVENIRTHGQDPRYRKSVLGSFALHIVVLILIPFLLQFVGCVEPYRIPKGRGEAAPPPTVRKVVKPRKKKHYVVNPNSPILFSVPDFDQVAQQVDAATQLTYKADPNRVHGTGSGLGAGGKGPGGWPDGMDNAVVRFIRLEYNGSAWDDGMDAMARADMNFLEWFKKQFGFKIAREPESNTIQLLRKYPKGFAPPFVYMTGNGNINVSGGEVNTLRQYLLDGGMLFADCSSPQWDRSFRAFVQVLFPGEPLRVIADDDPIFQVPFTFPNGAPPLWHHGGSHAMGIKHRDRWVVFYHPGDLNDAWKTGHSGLDPSMAEGAFEMGGNIVYYAFTHYLEETRKYRK